MRNNLFFLGLLLVPVFALGQTAAPKENQNMDLNYKEIDKIEQVLETNFPIVEVPAESKQPSPRPPIRGGQKADFRDVGSSSLYSDLAVIQKNYMPKSGRFQLTAGLVTVPTDVFYLTGGLSLRALYHFNEAWGAELFYNYLSSSARPEIDNISNNNNVSVQNLVSLKSFMGANVYYNFMYGKMSMNETKVLPFELYNTIGGGNMTNSQNYSSSAVQVGMGGLLSLTRSTALRLDLTWAFYSTKNIVGQDSNENSTFLNLGYSWFFPEPDYR